MSRRTKSVPIHRVPAGLIAAAMVFGLTVLMVVERYDPAVITTVVTGTSLAAAELVRRLQALASVSRDRDDEPEERS